ncbi:McrC family protein [Streptomyces sp. NBC_01762]|uniref:McrC family protein n=1 Tax=Streptomyces sp. NBC_01762 TaxID=2975933 RepID=UPI002DDA2BDC|nr:PE-PGRS family protein [Streptomyces sp. NBC_01762]WSC42569.1 McrC family protein [Streptomyces sp. NBC_01762]WSC50284.1 McrC family protein [Streptomyces sp. NBC_01762]
MGDPHARLEEIRLGEYERREVQREQLTDTDLSRLRSLTDQRCLRVSETRYGWRIEALSTVGVLVLDRIRLVIEPKTAVDGSRLISWLCYALHLPVRHAATPRGWETDRAGFTDLVISALVAECRALLLGGLRRDYVRRDLVEPVLRGRLDLTAQVSRRYGQLDRLHLRTFERDAAIWENQVCSAALDLAARLADRREPSRAAAETAALFPRPTTRAAAVRMLTRARYTRLNARYRPAHAWARLLLDGGGVDDLLVGTGHTADSMLLRMENLWEAVVRRMAVEVAAGMSGRPVPTSGDSAIRVSGDLSSHSPFRPDVLLCFANTPPMLLAVDAKYKRYDNRSTSAGDIHQMLTYTAGYSPAGTGAALVVHPSPAGATHRRLRVTAPRGQLAELHVAGIDVRLSPQDAAQALAPVLTAALHSTGHPPAAGTIPPQSAQRRAAEAWNVPSPRSAPTRQESETGSSPG